VSLDAANKLKLAALNLRNKFEMAFRCGENERKKH
jgi:hypothetical protein